MVQVGSTVFLDGRLRPADDANPDTDFIDRVLSKGTSFPGVTHWLVLGTRCANR